MIRVVETSTERAKFYREVEVWVSSHTSARTDRGQLVLELKKGSAMTKHWSLYHYRQGKPVKRRLEYQAKFGRKLRES